MVFAVIIVFGIALGFFYSSLPTHHPQKNRQSCESVGGQWSDEQMLCLLAYKKSDELCTDGAQCISGICSPPSLSEEQRRVIMSETLKDIIGTCSSNNSPIGCVEQVVMGTVSKESICLSD
jgi:hypothetical protein